MELPICYEDDDLIAVNKPSGLLVHRSKIDRSATTFALQTVRNMVGHHVYPVHRLDKPTSGVLLFARTPVSARLLGEQFTSQSVRKTYVAVTRGFPPASGCIDRPLRVLHDRTTDERAHREKPAQPAATAYHRLDTATLPITVGRYPSARYALVALRPHTGRQHQLRRHLNSISHPILGDYKHGDYRHNRAVEAHYGVMRLFLHAALLHLRHPTTSAPLTISATLDATFSQLLQVMDWKPPQPEQLTQLPFSPCIPGAS